MPTPKKPVKKKGWSIYDYISLRTMTLITAFLGSLFGVIVAGPKAWEVAEPYTPATSGWVRTHADKVTGMKISPFEQRIDKVDSLLARNDSEMARILLVSLKRDLHSANNELKGAPDSVVIKDRIADLKNEIEAAEIRLKRYQIEPAGKREVTAPSPEKR